MAWNSGARAGGKGSGGKGAKAGGKGGAAGPGKGSGSGPQQPSFSLQQIAAEMLRQKEKKEKELQQGKPKHWCCPCGFTENFLKRDNCFKCGLAKGKSLPPPPPGLPPAKEEPAAAKAKDKDGDEAMKVIPELSLEDKIKGLQGDIKWMKVSPIPETRAHVVHYEAELQKLLDQQKKERPLPARMQAASARVEKTKVAHAEAVKKVATVEEQLKLAKENLEETGKQAKEAEAELQAVKMAAGEDLASATAVSMVGAVQQVLAQVHDAKVVQEMVDTIKMHFQMLMTGAGAGGLAGLMPPGPPAPAGAEVSRQQVAQAQMQMQAGAAAQGVQAAAGGQAPSPGAGSQQSVGQPLQSAEPRKTAGRGRSPALSTGDSSGDSSGEGGYTRSRSERKKQRKAAKRAEKRAAAAEAKAALEQAGLGLGV